MFVPVAIGSAAALALAFAVVGVEQLARRDATTVPATATSVTAAAPPSRADVPPAPIPTPGESNVSAPVAAPVATVDPLVVASAPAASKPPGITPARPPDDTRAPSVRARPPASAKPASSAPRCSMVSWFDGDGMKHFKQVCQ